MQQCITQKEYRSQLSLGHISYLEIDGNSNNSEALRVYP